MQQFADLACLACTQVVRLASLPLHCGEIKTAYGVIYVEERPTRLQVADFYDWRLQTLLDANQLPDEIRGCIIRLARARGIEEPNIYRRDLVVQKIFAGQQIQADFADSIGVQRPQRLLFFDRYGRCWYLSVFGARTSGDDYWSPLQMPHSFEQ